MNLRHLRYFVALAAERHHGRAAARCNVTQPTLSEAVRQLERDLGVPLVERGGQRFRGLTAEGERILGWAQRILADEDALGQELAEMRQGLAGDLRFGIIPAAMATVPLVTAPFARAHPLVTLKLLARSSIEIQHGLDAGELEAGLTYLDNEPLRRVRTHTLYHERYMLLTPRGGAFDDVDVTNWREAARLPLCLLTRDMQNRRIIERMFASGGAGSPTVRLETNSVVALIAHVRSGQWSSIVPHTFLSLLGRPTSVLPGLRAIRLVEPDAAQAVGIVVADREPLPAMARALLKIVQTIDVSGQLDMMIDT